MQKLKQLEKQWNDTARFRGIQANLNLADNGLTLGAGTILAKRNHDRSLALEGEEPRVLTLLSVAYGRPVDASVLGSIRSASKHARTGNECMATMHIALAKLPRISDPVDAARRLFIASGLIEAGVAPRDIWNLLEFDRASLDRLEKYDPDQPRVPAGSGRPSGRWTNGGTPAVTASAVVLAVARAATEAVEEAAPKIAQRLPGIALRVAELASHVNLALDVLEEVLQASDTGGDKLAGSVRGLPDLQYSRQQDELALQLTDKSTGHTVATLYPTGVRGQYADRETGIVMQMEGKELVIRSVTSAISQAQTRESEPQQCPDPPLPDRAGMTGERGLRSKAYEAFMKEQTNPLEPTPQGMAYYLPNPMTGRLVSYDDCQHESTQDLEEDKGLGYANKVGPKGYPSAKANITRAWLNQATNQVLASEGRHLVWNFAELQAFEYARALFQGNPLLAGIEVRYSPWPNGERWRWSRSKRVWLRSLILLRLRKRLLELQNSLRRKRCDAPGPSKGRTALGELLEASANVRLAECFRRAPQRRIERKRA